ncbi:MAG: DoxX family protein [Rhodanobacteraceae bacterium]|nr:MAG: DoxX family protein [Rhodanobacteraceae bacterium]
MQNFTLLIGRLGLSLIFILSGIGKLTAYGATAKLLVAHGLPPGLLPLVIFAELGGGLAILCGLLTRWAAAGLFIYCILTAVIFHGHFADHEQWINFMKNLAIAGGFLVLAVHGAGGLSLDAWLRRRKQRQKIFF